MIQMIECLCELSILEIEKIITRASEARDCFVYDITKVQVDWVDACSRTSRLMLVIGHRSLPRGLSFCEA